MAESGCGNGLIFNFDTRYEIIVVFNPSLCIFRVALDYLILIVFALISVIMLVCYTQTCIEMSAVGLYIQCWTTVQVLVEAMMYWVLTNMFSCPLCKYSICCYLNFTLPCFEFLTQNLKREVQWPLISLMPPSIHLYPFEKWVLSVPHLMGLENENELKWLFFEKEYGVWWKAIQRLICLQHSL